MRVGRRSRWDYLRNLRQLRHNGCQWKNKGFCFRAGFSCGRKSRLQNVRSTAQMSEIISSVTEKSIRDQAKKGAALYILYILRMYILYMNRAHRAMRASLFQLISLLLTAIKQGWCSINVIKLKKWAKNVSSQTATRDKIANWSWGERKKGDTRLQTLLTLKRPTPIHSAHLFPRSKEKYCCKIPYGILSPWSGLHVCLGRV